MKDLPYHTRQVNILLPLEEEAVKRPALAFNLRPGLFSHQSITTAVGTVPAGRQKY